MHLASLADQRALVVGGATGIGFAVASALGRCGARVAVAGRRQSALDEAVRRYDGPGELAAHPVDVTDRGAVQRLVEWFERSIGPIDVLVVAAGVNVRNRSLAQTDPADWDRVLATNATGAFNCLKAVLPLMRSRRRGTVVAVSSVAGKRAIALGGVAYCASKFAMTALGTAAGQEAAADGVRITNVYPGEVDTPLLDARPTPVTDEQRAAMLRPADVAELVAALCSLPPHVHVPEVVIKPLSQPYV